MTKHGEKITPSDAAKIHLSGVLELAFEDCRVIDMLGAGEFGIDGKKTEIEQFEKLLTKYASKMVGALTKGTI